MRDPAARRLYLRPLPGGAVPGKHSQGARSRTAQLQRFLDPLERIARSELPIEGGVQLLVVAPRDWRRLSSYGYGLPFARTTGRLVTLVAAADYPPRLTRRFDDLLLRAGRAGTLPPGDVHEFLDLLLGHEWGHAAANRSGLRTRVKWFDELMATYLFVQALRSSGGEATLERLSAWARVQVAATGLQRSPLDAFEYPRGAMRLARMLWFQGVFTERALELSAVRGWEFPRELAARLPVGDRGELARTLVEVEPGFRSWFAVFAPAPDDAAAGARGLGDERGPATPSG